jgi:hypothetical protein
MTFLLPFISGLAGALVSALAAWIVRYQIHRKAEENAAKRKFDRALNSSDLTTLSRYLRNELGDIPVESYLHDPDIRQKVDRYLTHLSAYVAKPLEEPVLTPERGAHLPASPSKKADAATLENPEIQAALVSLRDGDTWSALARLRRDLEFRLMSLRAQGLSDRLGLGPGHHSGRFSLTTDVPPDWLPLFRRFWRTASSAVHGQAVSDEEAMQAIDDARALYAELEAVERSPPIDA